MPTATVAPLRPQHLTAVRDLLARDPASNLYLLGLLEEFGVVSANRGEGFCYWGRFVDGALQAVTFVGGTGGLVIPSASSLRDISDIARRLVGAVHPKAVLGERLLVDALLQQLAPSPEASAGAPDTTPPPAARLVDQRLWCVSADDLGPFTNPLLRLATEADVEALVPMAAACVQQVLHRDPLAEDPEGFPARVRQRVEAKRTYVLSDGGRLVFKVDVGSRSQFGAELEGLYTVPDARHRSHATLCLGQISRFLLSSLPRLTLRIDEANTALQSAARKVGYLARGAQRLAWLE